MCTEVTYQSPPRRCAFLYLCTPPTIYIFICTYIYMKTWVMPCCLHCQDCHANKFSDICKQIYLTVFYLLDLGAYKEKPSPKTLTQLAQWHNGTLCCPTRLRWWLLPCGDTNSQKHLCTVSKPDLFMPNFLVCLELSSVISLCNKIQFVL